MIYKTRTISFFSDSSIRTAYVIHSNELIDNALRDLYGFPKKAKSRIEVFWFKNEKTYIIYK